MCLSRTSDLSLYSSPPPIIRYTFIYSSSYVCTLITRQMPVDSTSKAYQTPVNCDTLARPSSVEGSATTCRLLNVPQDNYRPKSCQSHGSDLLPPPATTNDPANLRRLSAPSNTPTRVAIPQRHPTQGYPHHEASRRISRLRTRPLHPRHRARRAFRPPPHRRRPAGRLASHTGRRTPCHPAPPSPKPATRQRRTSCWPFTAPRPPAPKPKPPAASTIDTLESAPRDNYDTEPAPAPRTQEKQWPTSTNRMTGSSAPSSPTPARPPACCGTHYPTPSGVALTGRP